MKTAVATAIAFAMTALALAPTSACAEEPTRVLVVGDSVTQGMTGDYTWRYFAATDLAGRVDFVGPHKGTLTPGAVNDWNGTYAADFDNDHAARWGMSLTEMQDAPDANSPAIEDLVAEHRPDVIVEQLGVNDFDREELTAEQMTARVVEFVVDARTVNPDVDVVLGSIPQTWIREVGAYNALLPDVAARISTDASRVVVAPVADWVNGVDTYDFAHPTTSGQKKLAAAITAGLADLGIGGTAAAETVSVPAAAPAPTVPTPAETSVPTPRKVRAVSNGNRVVVSWRDAADVDRYAVRCGRVTKTAKNTRATLRTTAARCSVRSVDNTGTSQWVRVKVKQQR